MMYFLFSLFEISVLLVFLDAKKYSLETAFRQVYNLIVS